MKKIDLKKAIIVVIIISISSQIYSFDKGWTLGLRADFGGALTLPRIPIEDLKKLNPLATNMTGMLSNLLMGGQVSVGYIFDTNDLFPSLNEDSVFSGIGVNGYLGFGQGNASQKISATVTEGGAPLDIFMTVNYLPVIAFGVESDILLFDNRFSIGVGLGVKMIADFTPEFLVYSTAPDVVKTEIGTIIVTPDMMTKMNAFMISPKFELGYVVPILPTTELVLGFFTQYNVYQPKYLTVPPSLLEMAQTGMSEEEEQAFDEQINAPFPNYWLDSFDFGVNIGLQFKL